MFDIQTEAYLRRSRSNDDTRGGAPIIPAAIAASVVLWTTVLFTAI